MKCPYWLLATKGYVAPLVGAWIEIFAVVGKNRKNLSLLSWERGLKSTRYSVNQPFAIVAPLVGAWIEIFDLIITYHKNMVAPLVGAWIEIYVRVSLLVILLVAPLVGAWIEIYN